MVVEVRGGWMNQRLGDLFKNDRLVLKKEIMKKDKSVGKEMETVYKRPPGTWNVPDRDSLVCSKVLYNNPA